MDYRGMVEKISSGTVTELREGVKYVLKPIPDREGKGVLDPRLFACAKGGVGISYPKDYCNITPEELAKMREEIGAPNVSVTEGELEEERITLTHEGTAIYRYQKASKEKLPVLIYIHGGGFLGGEPAMCENLCRDIARTAPAAVFSVEYRLSPEHFYPYGLQDCFEAVDWVLSHLDTYHLDASRVSIAGDSAGGNLALCCSMRESQKESLRIQKQILLYPAINIGKYDLGGESWREDFYSWSSDEQERDVQSKLAHDVGIFDDMMVEAYAGGMEKTKDPYVCPVLNKEWFHMPKTTVVLGEYDYLVQEGVYLAKQIADAGVPSTVLYYYGMCHAFGEHLGDFPQAEDLMREMADIVRR